MYMGLNAIPGKNELVFQLFHGEGGTVGLDPSLGKSTDETMQLFYLCGFVQTYGNIGGLFLHT